MSSPFGGHPQFAEYIQWACEQGCTVKSGYVNSSSGQPLRTTKITSPKDKWVIVLGLSQKEFLEPSMVSYLDRRLNMESPFPGTPSN